MTPLLTVAELAARWQRTEPWVREQAKAGSIPAVRIGGRWRFDPDLIEAYETRHSTQDPMSLTELSAKRQARRAS